ncbi:hypothetical protein SGLAM104S_10482 [Streptomyces glaucescens]
MAVDGSAGGDAAGRAAQRAASWGIDGVAGRAEVRPHPHAFTARRTGGVTGEEVDDPHRQWLHRLGQRCALPLAAPRRPGPHRQRHPAGWAPGPDCSVQELFVAAGLDLDRGARQQGHAEAAGHQLDQGGEAGGGGGDRRALGAAGLAADVEGLVAQAVPLVQEQQLQFLQRLAGDVARPPSPWSCGVTSTKSSSKRGSSVTPARPAARRAAAGQAARRRARRGARRSAPRGPGGRGPGSARGPAAARWAAGTARRSGSRRAAAHRERAPAPPRPPPAGRATASSTALARTASRSPAGESSTLRVVRSRRDTQCLLQAETAPESAGWLMPIAAAASRKWRCSATAAKARSWERLGWRRLPT